MLIGTFKLAAATFLILGTGASLASYQASIATEETSQTTPQPSSKARSGAKGAPVATGMPGMAGGGGRVEGAMSGAPGVPQPGMAAGMMPGGGGAVGMMGMGGGTPIPVTGGPGIPTVGGFGGGLGEIPQGGGPSTPGEIPVGGGGGVPLTEPFSTLPLSEWPILKQADPRSEAVHAALLKDVAFKFPSDTPLSDVIKFIKDMTRDKGAGFEEGLQIYVDPQGLQEVDKTIASTISIDLEPVALSVGLRLLLKQLNLGYKVENGILIITSEKQIPSPLEILEEKARRGELTNEQAQELLRSLKLQGELLKARQDLDKIRNGVQ